MEITVGDGLTKGDVLKSWDAIASHPAYPNATGGLVIFGRDTKWHVSGSEVSELGRQVRKLKPLHWAFVAPDPLSFGMARMFASQAEGGGVYQTFHNEGAARKWLNSVKP